MKKEVTFSERLGVWVMNVAGKNRDIYGYYKKEAQARAELELTAALVKAGLPLSAGSVTAMERRA